jgi:chromosome segregation ATPase
MAWTIEIENVGGIRSGTATLEPGSNAVRGTNWQGKSSFVAAVETVMGTGTELMEGEKEGSVTLSTPDETVSVTLVRENGTVTRRGEPFLPSEKTRVAASLYAFLDDRNPVRTAVRNDENLEAVLTRPLEFENIDERIAELTREREQVERELEDAEEAARQLPATQETITQLESELGELTEQREAMQGEGDGESVSGRREELSDRKAERETVEQRLTRLERSVDRTREKLAAKRSELEQLDIPETEVDFAAKIEQREEKRDRLERDAELLQSVYAPTKRILDEDRLELITEVEPGVLADDVACWTCGSTTSREEIEGNLDELGNRIATLSERAREFEREVAELQERRQDVEQAARRRDDLEAEITDLEATLEERETSLERTRERHDELGERIDELAATVEQTDVELTEVKSRVKYTKRQLEDAREKLDRLESRAARREQLEAEREEVTDGIHRLRERKTELKRRTREAFDDAIREILSRFDMGFEMVRLTPEFDLVVARDGREASLAALSEGERELLGIVAALAGHAAFDVTDDVPVMLLDGLGGLADDNLGTLIDYLEDRAEFLVFTAHPENTAFEEHTIDPTEWSVVSPEHSPPPN